VCGVKLLRAANLKRPLWRGGPQLDEVVKAQLAPAAAAPAAALPPGPPVATATAEPPVDEDTREGVQLLLLLR
jgi:hypothetical protein